MSFFFFSPSSPLPSLPLSLPLFCSFLIKPLASAVECVCVWPWAMSEDEDDLAIFLDRDGYLTDNEDGGITVFEGQRRGRIYKLDDYFYTREKKGESTGVTYFRCREKLSEKCKARAHASGTGPLKVTPGFERHSHPSNPAFGQFLTLRNQLIESMMKQPNKSLTLMFKEFVRE